MARECQVCGKKPRSGNSVSHSNRKTKRRWLPNLQSLRLPVEGVTGKLRLCTGCIKTITRKLVA